MQALSTARAYKLARVGQPQRVTETSTASGSGLRSSSTPMTRDAELSLCRTLSFSSSASDVRSSRPAVTTQAASPADNIQIITYAQGLWKEVGLSRLMVSRGGSNLSHHCIQVEEGISSVSEAASLMERRLDIVRQHPGGSDIIIRAFGAAKAMTPPVFLKFTDDNLAVYLESASD